MGEHYGSINDRTPSLRYPPTTSQTCARTCTVGTPAPCSAPGGARPPADMYNYLFPPPRSTRLPARLRAARRERWLLGTPPARDQLPLHRCQTKPAHHTQNSYINTQSHRVHRRKSESAGIEAPQSRQCRAGVRRGRTTSSSSSPSPCSHLARGLLRRCDLLAVLRRQGGNGRGHPSGIQRINEEPEHLNA